MRHFKSVLLSMILVLTVIGFQLNAATPPATQAGFITFQNTTNSGTTMNWVNGSGAGRIVVVSTANDFNANPPQDNTTYTVIDQGSYSSANNPILGAGKVIYNGTGSQNSVDVTGLGANTTYWFRVYEYNQGGNPSPAYNTNTRTLNPRQMKTAPAAPTNIAANPITSYSAYLTWTASVGATSYRLDLSTSNVDFNANIVEPYNDLDIGDITEWELTDLDQNTPYYVRLRSVADGLSSTSTNYQFQTIAGAAPMFAIQYYSDAALTTALGANPRLKVGTYYLALTSDQPLQEAPELRIDANGNSTWENPPDVTPQVGTTGYGDNVYVYTRSVAQDATLTGANLEQYIIYATGLSGVATNTGLNLAINGYPTGAAYIDTQSPAIIGVTAKDGDADYKAGDNIIINVQFSEIVVVTGGSPRLRLNVGGAERYATYNGVGTNTNTLEFLYTVQSGDINPDLDYVATTSLGLNGGEIKDRAGNAAVLTLPAPGGAGSLSFNNTVNVDGVIPTITNVTSALANGTYGEGQVVDVLVTFSEDVNLNTAGGTPFIIMNTNPAQNAVYELLSYDNVTFTATFNYTVVNGDYSADLDYASNAAFNLNGAVIADAAGNNANTTLPDPGETGSLGANKNIVIDAVLPAVSSVTSSTANGLYGIGATIEIQVVFNKIVNVAGGTPTLTLNTGAVVNYVDGSGSTTLNFSYIVAEGQQSLDLDYQLQTSLANGGATIRDAANTNASLTLPNPGAPGSLGANKDIVIDGIIKTVQNVTSTNADGSYGNGSVITITVQFSGIVNVAGGTPQLTLNTNPSRTIDYVSGTGTNTLTFTYTVQSNDVAADLDYAATNSLALNGATVKDNAGNNANLALPAPAAAGSLSNNKDIVINAIAPTITSVTGVTGTYTVGQTINITVHFTKNVVIAGGVPTLALNIAGNTKLANYTIGTGTQDIVFQYVVENGDNQNPLEYVDVNSLALNGATIYDQITNNPNAANNTLPALGSGNSLAASNIVINTNQPTIMSVSSDPLTATYKAGDVITITVQFSEVVNVNTDLGNPRLRLGIVKADGISYITRYAIYQGVGTGTTTLEFNYTVQNGDNTPVGGLEYYHKTDPTLAFDLNGSTIKSNTNNLDAITTLKVPGEVGSLSFNTDITVDTKAPIVTNVTSLQSGAYAAGQVISINIVFSENVIILPNSAKLLLETGDIDRYANYASGNGTSTLTFTYTVNATDYTSHLDYFDEWSLENVGGFIHDAAGNNAELELPTPGDPGSLSDNTHIWLVGNKPYITDMNTVEVSGNYSVGQIINVQVTFNEAVDVTGEPIFYMQTNNGLRPATYNGGTGTDVLNFAFPILEGDYTDDLDYNEANFGTLNGGTIKRAGTAIDAVILPPEVGSTHSISFHKTIVIYTVAPTVDVTYNNYNPVDGKVYFDVVFSQNVEGFGTPATDVVAGGIAFNAVNPTVEINGLDAAHYQVAVSGMNQNGTVTVQIPAGVANIPGFVTLTNTASNPDGLFNYVGTPPTVAITDAYPLTLATDQLPVRFTVTFDMPVTGFGDDVDDVDIIPGGANVTGVNITPVAPGMTQFYVDVTVDVNGTVQIQIPEGAAQSVNGRVNNEASLPSNVITFTAPAPEVVSITPDVLSTINLPINFEVIFNEDVFNFDETGITIGGTAAAGATAVVTGAGTTYNVAINNVTVLGTINITVNADAAQNSFGTGNLVSLPSADVTYWGIAPIPTITYVGADPTSVSPIDFTVTFDQNVQGFEDADIVIGGTALPTTAVVTGGPAIYNVAVSGMSQAGTVNINLLPGAAQNLGGMPSGAQVIVDNEVTFDIAAPEVTINKAVLQDDPTGNQPIWFDVVFDQDVTGFDNAADVTVVSDNPLQGAFNVTILPVDAKNYQVRVAGITKNGTITATIPAGVAINGFGVANNASTSIDNTVEFEYEAPTLTLEIDGSQVNPAIAEPVLFTAMFDQEVTGFDAFDIIIGGTAEPGTGVTVEPDLIDPLVYHISIDNITQNGTLNVSVAADAAQNSYGTGNLAAGPSDDVNFWGIAPTATIERKAGQGSPTQALPIEFTVTFDQQVTGFDVLDIDFGASTANPSNITVTPAAGPAAVYTVSVGNVANNGTVIIGFGAGAAQNAGGVDNEAPVYNPNEAGVTVEFTMPAPTCVIALSGGQVSPTNTLPISFTATFSQNVYTLEPADIVLTGDGSVGAVVTEINGGNQVFEIVIEGATVSGPINVQIPAGVVENQYNEPNLASNIETCVYDITRPTPTITLDSPDPTNATPILYTVEFDEPVFGFDANALTVTGPFPGGIATINIIPVGLGQTEWTIEISGMNADGLVSLSVDENAVTDLAQNGNFAAGPVTCQYNIPPAPPPGPAVDALSVRYFTRTTMAINITQPELPTILIGKQIAAGPLAPALTGDIANYAAIASLTFNHNGTLDDGSCVLYVGNADEVIIRSLQRNKAYKFALYTYDAESGFYCLDADAALLSQTTQNRESLTEQPGAIAGVNIALSQISPNPVVNNVNLTMDLFTDANITVQVIDGNGQVISVPVNGNFYAEGTHTLSFPLQNVASGSYILRVSTGNEAVIQRFIYMP